MVSYLLLSVLVACSFVSALASALPPTPLFMRDDSPISVSNVTAQCTNVCKAVDLCEPKSATSPVDFGCVCSSKNAAAYTKCVDCVGTFANEADAAQDLLDAYSAECNATGHAVPDNKFTVSKSGAVAMKGVSFAVVLTALTASIGMAV